MICTCTVCGGLYTNDAAPFNIAGNMRACFCSSSIYPMHKYWWEEFKRTNPNWPGPLGETERELTLKAWIAAKASPL